jgi:hypothetical protein
MALLEDEVKEFMEWRAERMAARSQPAKREASMRFNRMKERPSKEAAIGHFHQRCHGRAAFLQEGS